MITHFLKEKNSKKKMEKMIEFYKCKKGQSFD